MSAVFTNILIKESIRKLSKQKTKKIVFKNVEKNVVNNNDVKKSWTMSKEKRLDTKKSWT